MVSGMAWGAARPAMSVRVGAKIRQVGCRKTPGCQQHSRDGDKAKGASFTPTRVPEVEEAGEEGKCKMDSQRQAVGYWEGFPIFCPTIHPNPNPKLSWSLRHLLHLSSRCPAPPLQHLGCYKPWGARTSPRWFCCSPASRQPGYFGDPQRKEPTQPNTTELRDETIISSSLPASACSLPEHHTELGLQTAKTTFLWLVIREVTGSDRQTGFGRWCQRNMGPLQNWSFFEGHQISSALLEIPTYVHAWVFLPFNCCLNPLGKLL